jgi:hypothetical protein
MSGLAWGVVIVIAVAAIAIIATAVARKSRRK